MYIRFQGPCGGGLFHIVWLEGWAGDRPPARLPRAEQRELQNLKAWLWAQTPEPPAEAYEDWACRYPRTWFKPTAREHIRAAWRIADIVTRRGTRIRPIQARTLRILWEDEVQVVARQERTSTRVRPRRPHPAEPRWDGDRTTIRRWRAPLPVRGPPSHAPFVSSSRPFFVTPSLQLCVTPHKLHR